MRPSDATVHPNLEAVELPHGGTAWVRRRLSVEQNRLRVAAMLGLTRVLPADQLAALTPESDPLALVNALGDPAAALDAVTQYRINVVSACAWGWDGVTNPDGDAIEFPAGVKDMDADDLASLFEAQEAALAGERADPNASRAP